MSFVVENLDYIETLSIANYTKLPSKLPNSYKCFLQTL